MKNKILVTGGAGFIGSEFVRQYASKFKIIVVDKLTYAGDRKRLEEVTQKIKFYKIDIVHPTQLKVIFQKEKPQYLIHFAAETHVDRSIVDSTPFLHSNVLGTQNLINLALQFKVKRFLHISTDEVYGDRKKLHHRFKESSPLNPSNPYSASKAASEMIVSSAIRTHKLPAIILRPCNNYGHWQHPEKFIPVIITKTLKNQKIPLYGKGLNKREWIHVSDCARAVFHIFRKGRNGEIYNIGSNIERNNITLTKTILKYMDRPNSLIKSVKDRPGHDVCYGMNCTKIKNLGWSTRVALNEGLKETITWYQNNSKWLKNRYTS